MVLFKQIVEDGPGGEAPHSDSSWRRESIPEAALLDRIEVPNSSASATGRESLKKLYLDLHVSATDTSVMSDTISIWLTKYIGFETRLVYIGQHSRVVLRSGAPDGDMACEKRSPFTASVRRILPSAPKAPIELITFRDIDQYLVVTKESNDEVSSCLADGVSMDITKFRPCCGLGYTCRLRRGLLG
jgi:hypothetical protein